MTTTDDYNHEVFKLYKTFRNSIKKYPLEDSLGVVRAYSQYLAYDIPIPSDMTVFPGANDFAQGVHQWELEIIARECIAHSPLTASMGLTMRDHTNFLEVLNKLRRLEDQISGLVTSTENVLVELHRIGHRQFQWQTGIPTNRLNLRYYKIFSHPLVEPFVQEKIGLDVKTIYTLGLGLTGTYIKWFALHYPPDFNFSKKHNANQENLDKFLGHFSLDVDTLRSNISSELRENMNERYAYFFDSFKSYPLIRMNANGKDSLVAPIPTMLIWRFTQGIYYEVYDMEGFGDAFGQSQEAYIGEVLKDILKSPFLILPAEPTANDRGVPSSDWFVEDESSVMYIESKTKRLALGAKISLSDTTQLETQLKILAEAVRQVYQCIDAAQKGSLQGDAYANFGTKKPFPIVVTLESWYIFGQTWERLNEFAKVEMEKYNLPTEWLDLYPFTVCDVSEFENLMRTIHVTQSMQEVFKEKYEDPELRRYELYTYLYNRHPEELKTGPELFEGEFEALFN